MNSCKHEVITLLEPKKKKLCCRHCHLMISEDELGNGCCPECLDVHKVRRRDFKPVDEPDSETVRYRCESCGMVVECC